MINPERIHRPAMSMGRIQSIPEDEEFAPEITELDDLIRDGGHLAWRLRHQMRWAERTSHDRR